MQPQWQTATHGQGYSGDVAESRNKVLRNTYLMLALTMIPTALGAWAGTAMQFAMRGWTGLIVFLVVSFGMFYAISKTKHSPLGVVLLLAYTGFMGLWLSQILQVALKFSNGAQLIGLAAAGTGTIFFTLATLATVIKKDLSFMSKFLFVGVILLMLTAVANIFLQLPALSLAISAIAVLIFSAYILYDVSQIVNGGETNYVWATLQLYLDIYNVFTSLLHLLMSLGGERD
ncbi:Bax inhibitor-1/YccA family protein [Chitinimonas lacunae]|uniref:Bax inhibitor-1/YccA family protein n=1 Tax=Chitinimonas lacunae TaxID=1963018 RepID=A0ABV8MNI4_9NEIS